MRRILVFLCVALAAATPAAAQSDSAIPTAEILPAIEGEQIMLPTVPAGTPDTEQWNRFIGQVWVRNVTRPSLYRIAPMNGRDNGRAVIVVPGGGYAFVSIEPEGFWVAQRLAAQGYTAFVLKYRTQTTAETPDQFVRDLTAEWSASDEEIGAEDYRFPPAVDDLAAAVALVHSRAGDWGLDPDAIGVIGFSAGAISAMDLLEGHPEAALLDHAALIYPPMEDRIDAQSRPDLFMAIAVDDFLLGENGLSMVQNWLDESRDLEFHLYSGGGHGFGMRPQGTTSDLWIDQYLAWLALQ